MLIYTIAYVICRYAVTDVHRELSLESFVVFFFESFHVVRDMLAKYMLSVHISVERLRFIVIAWKSLGAARKQKKKTTLT